MTGRTKTGSRAARLLARAFEPLLGREDPGRVLRGAGLAMAVRSGAMAVNYLVVLLLARWMGAAEFGRYSFAIALVTILMLPATLGLGISIVKFIPVYLARVDWSGLRSLLRRSTELVLGTSVVIALIAAGILHFAFADSTYAEPARLAILALPLWAFVSLLSEVARGFGWIGIAYTPAHLGTALLTLAAAVGLLALDGLDATHLVAGTIVAYASVLVVQVGLLGPRLSPRLRGPMGGFRTREWVGTSLPMLVFMGSYVVITQTDILMVGALLGPDGAGHYTAAARTATLVLFVQGVVSNIAEPQFARYAGERRWGELQHLTAQLLPWTVGLSLLLTLAVAGGGYWFLRIMGDDFVAGFGPLCILAVGYLGQAALGLVSGLLNMTGEHRACAFAHGLAAVANVALNALFIPIWGINGAALATATTVVGVNAALLVVVRRRLHVEPSLLQFWSTRA